MYEGWTDVSILCAVVVSSTSEAGIILILITSGERIIMEFDGMEVACASAQKQVS